MPQGVEVYFVFCQSGAPHQPFEHGLGAVICTQCPLVGPENEVFGRGEGNAAEALLFLPPLLPFEEGVFQYFGHGYFPYARDGLGVGDDGLFGNGVSLPVERGNDGNGIVDIDDAVDKIDVLPLERERFADAQSREHLDHA